jgi:hypothetical protein
MTQDISDFSRRTLLGAGVLAGTAAVSALLGEMSPAKAALATDTPGLTYVGVDAQAFWPSVASDRYYDDAIGTGTTVSNTRIWAPLHLPLGSVIRQISISYYGQPIMEISSRSMTAGGAPTPLFQQTVPASGGLGTATYDLTSPVLVQSAHTYTTGAFLTAGASIVGVQIGYSPPTLGFHPATRANPRIFDTTVSGGPLVVGAPRSVFTGGKGMVRAVVNISAKQAAGAGYIACYKGAAASTLPSVPFAAGLVSENLVIAPLNAGGAFSLLAYGNNTHAAVDLVGFLR